MPSLPLYLSRCLRLPSLMTLSLHSLPRFPRATRRTSSSRERTSSQRVSLADTHSLLPASTHTHNRTHTLSLTGRYACEVSTESPSYATVRAEQELQVYVTPRERLHITGLSDLLTSGRQELRDGDLVNLTCVTGASRPAPRVTWSVNGLTVSLSCCCC